MRPSRCLSFLGAILKLLNFFHGFAGLALVLYAAWILDNWVRRGGKISLDALPNLWYIATLMGIGVLFCLIVLAGFVAAETNSGFCLCFYSIFAMVLVILEATLVGELILNKQWVENLPYDPTGELDNTWSFVQNNMEVCKWVALSVVGIQALSLFLALVLRAMVSTRRVDYDSDEDFLLIRRPLLVSQGIPTYVPSAVSGRGFESDNWRYQTRQQYGLNQGDYSYSQPNPKATPSLQ